MKFVVEAASIADWFAILVSEEKKKGRKWQLDWSLWQIMISNENVDDQNLLHNVVAVVLQLAQDVPSLRDEDCKDFLRILISWIISHFEPQQKKNTYLIFVIFFTQAKFLENKIYTEKTRKLRQNTQ